MPVEVEALLARLEEDPDNPDHEATYLVLADALQVAGDPRGELIQLSHRLATGADGTRGERWALANRERALVGEDRARILGRYDDDRTVLDHRLGFATAASVRGPFAAMTLAAILRAPEARLLRSATLRLDDGDDLVQHGLGMITTVPRALHRFVLERRSYDPHAPHERTCVGTRPARGTLPERRPALDDLGGVLAKFPQLRELVVDLGLTSVDWAPLRSPHLRRFAWVTPYADPREVAPLAGSELPALEAFELWVGARHVARADAPANGGDPPRDRALSPIELAPILAMLDRCPSLRALGLCNIGHRFGAILHELLAHPFLARLEVLDVSACDAYLDGDALPAILRAAPNLSRVCVAGAVLQRSVLDALVAARITVEGTPRDRPLPVRERYRQIHEPW